MKTLIVAPHPDDEILGCGGTILRKVFEGETVGLLFMTSMIESEGWSKAQISTRIKELSEIQKKLKIDKKNFFELNLPAAKLDTLPLGDIIAKTFKVFKSFQPDEVFLPHPGDVHSDHRICFEASIPCTKWFRLNSIKRVYTYETLSETDVLTNESKLFVPNTFIDISNTLKEKIKLLKIYKSEVKKFPFPRSEKAVKSLAEYRGSQSGFLAAEAFQLLKVNINDYKKYFQGLEKIILPEASSILDAAKNLEENGVQIVLVVDKKKCLVGTVSDGDIRRGLLAGLDLNSSVLKVVNKKPE